MIIYTKLIINMIKCIYWFYWKLCFLFKCQWNELKKYMKTKNSYKDQAADNKQFFNRGIFITIIQCRGYLILHCHWYLHIALYLFIYYIYKKRNKMLKLCVDGNPLYIHSYMRSVSQKEKRSLISKVTNSETWFRE